MKKYKTLALLLALILALSCLTACGGKKTDDVEDGNNPDAIESTLPDPVEEDGDSGDSAAPSEGDEYFVTAGDDIPYIDLTDGSYDGYTAEQLFDLLSQEDMSRQTRVHVFGVIDTVKYEDHTSRFISAVWGKSADDLDGINIKDGVPLPENSLVFPSSVPEDALPNRLAIVELTGVWAQDPDPIASDNYFHIYVEDFQILGEAGW